MTHHFFQEQKQELPADYEPFLRAQWCVFSNKCTTYDYLDERARHLVLLFQ